VELWADASTPLHLYREQYVERVPAFVARCAARFDRQPKVTLSMVVRNEADRYLSMMLQHVLPLIDEAVIIDDGSTDGTVQMIHEILRDKHVIHQLDHSLFSNEHELRRLQWEKTLASNPDWILNLDADEILEPQAGKPSSRICRRPRDPLGFRLFDFWSDTTTGMTLSGRPTSALALHVPLHPGLRIHLEHQPPAHRPLPDEHRRHAPAIHPFASSTWDGPAQPTARPSTSAT
jgi:hypothetical protein